MTVHVHPVSAAPPLATNPHLRSQLVVGALTGMGLNSAPAAASMCASGSVAPETGGCVMNWGSARVHDCSCGSVLVYLAQLPPQLPVQCGEH